MDNLRSKLGWFSSDDLSSLPGASFGPTGLAGWRRDALSRDVCSTSHSQYIKPNIDSSILSVPHSLLIMGKNLQRNFNLKPIHINSELNP